MKVVPESGAYLKVVPEEVRTLYSFRVAVFLTQACVLYWTGMDPQKQNVGRGPSWKIFDSQISLMEIPTAHHVIGLIEKKFADARDAISEALQQLKSTNLNDFMTFGMNNLRLKVDALTLQGEFYQFFFDKPLLGDDGNFRLDDDGNFQIPCELSLGRQLEGQYRREAVQAVLDEAFISGETALSVSEFFRRCQEFSKKGNLIFVDEENARAQEMVVSAPGVLAASYSSSKDEGDARSKTTLFFAKMAEAAEKFEMASGGPLR